MNETAQIIHDMQCGTYREVDTRIVCKHCGQRVNDRNINHASTGCTVKVMDK